MRRTQGFLVGIALAAAFAAGAQVGGKIAEVNAATVYADTVRASSLIATPPSYTDDTEACAGGLVAGQLYHDDSGATVVVVASC